MIVYLVHKKIGLSPGEFTRRRAILNDIKRAKKRALTNTREARKRRLKRKLERGSKSTSVEVREGATYKSGVELEELDNEDVEAVPPPTYPPLENQPLDTGTYVYFDLEATGLERNSHITQIAALDEESEQFFCCYVLPKKPITYHASRITKLTLKGNTVLHDGKAVEAIPIKDAIQALISFLKDLPSKKQKILVGHNVKAYDCHVLMNALKSCNMIDIFHDIVIGYMDTMKLFRLSFPSLKSFSQQNLSRVLLGDNFSYGAYDALEDIKTLKKIVLLPSVISDNKHICEFSTNYVVKSMEYNTIVKRNLPSLQVLVNRKVITAGMARKIAGSNLSLHHLEIVYKRDGKDGLSALLDESVSGRVRVSRSQKVITSLCDYFLE